MMGSNNSNHHPPTQDKKTDTPSHRDSATMTEEKESPATAITPNGASARTALSIPATPTTQLEKETIWATKEERATSSTGLPIGFSDTGSAKTAGETPIDAATINALRAGNLFGKSKEGLKDAPLVIKGKVAATSTIAPAGPETPKTAVAPKTSSFITQKKALSASTTPKNAMSCGKDLKTPTSAPRTAMSKTPLSRAMATPKTALTRTPLSTTTPTTAATPGMNRTSRFRTPQQLNTATGGPTTPTSGLRTAITPNGLSCKTAKTLEATPLSSTKTAKVMRTPARAAEPPITPQTPKIKTVNSKSNQKTDREMKTPVTSGQKKARRTLFPKLKIVEPKGRKLKSEGSDKSKNEKMPKETKRNPLRSPEVSAASKSRSLASSLATGRSFEPPGTPHTCHEIDARVLAERKSEQQKVVLTSSTPDGQFKVEVRIKMKIVGGGSEPQAMVTKSVVVDGQQHYPGQP